MLEKIEIERYGFNEHDTIIATMVKGYLITNPEAAPASLNEIVKAQAGKQYRIDGPKLSALIDSAKSVVINAADSCEAHDDSMLREAIAVVKEETIPQISGKKYVETMPVAFAEFITDCWREMC